MSELLSWAAGGVIGGVTDLTSMITAALSNAASEALTSLLDQYQVRLAQSDARGAVQQLAERP